MSVSNQFDFAFAFVVVVVSINVGLIKYVYTIVDCFNVDDAQTIAHRKAFVHFSHSFASRKHIPDENARARRSKNNLMEM